MRITRTTSSAGNPPAQEKAAPVRPGTVLKNEFFDRDPGLNQGVIAWRLGINRSTLNQLLNNEKKAVSAEMALRLERFFPGSSAETWLYAQCDYDVFQVRTDAKVMREIEKVQPWEGSAAAELTEETPAAGTLRFPRELAAERIRKRLASTRRVPVLTLRPGTD